MAKPLREQRCGLCRETGHRREKCARFCYWCSAGCREGVLVAAHRERACPRRGAVDAAGGRFTDALDDLAAANDATETPAAWYRVGATGLPFLVIVESDELAAVRLLRTLRPWCSEVVIASTLAAAMPAIAYGKPELLALNAGFGGDHAIHRVRELRRLLPEAAIVVTSDVAPHSGWRARAESDGATNWFEKAKAGEIAWYAAALSET